MATNALTVIINEISLMKAEDINVYGISAMILAKFASIKKRIAWKELIKMHNARCLPCLRVSEYSDGRDGLNVRNEWFEIEHDLDHPLHGVVSFKKNPNEVVHASDGIKRSFLDGIMLKHEVSNKKLAKFYSKK